MNQLTHTDLTEEYKAEYLSTLVLRLAGCTFKLKNARYNLWPDPTTKTVYFKVGEYKVEVTPNSSSIYVTIISPDKYSVTKILPFQMLYNRIEDDITLYLATLSSQLTPVLDAAFPEIHEARRNHDIYCGREV